MDDEWSAHEAAGLQMAKATVKAGAHDFVLEYRQGSGSAEVHLIAHSTAAAVASAKTADAAIVFVGTDKDNYDHENSDKPNLNLIAGEDDLVSAVLAANPRPIVVLVKGSAVERP